MLKKWEAGDEKVIELWKKMNQWVYDGFATTYTNLELILIDITTKAILIC